MRFFLNPTKFFEHLRFQLAPQVSLGVNYQPIVHPAFNQDRGPVHVFTGRAHVSF